jgi:hypothetical protein
MKAQTLVPDRRPVHRVTLLSASWSERDRAARGTFELTLRDESGEEYVLQTAPEDADALLQFLASSHKVLFELGDRIPGLKDWSPSRDSGSSVRWAEASLMHT